MYCLVLVSKLLMPHTFSLRGDHMIMGTCHQPAVVKAPSEALRLQMQFNIGPQHLQAYKTDEPPIPEDQAQLSAHLWVQPSQVEIIMC